MPSVEPLDLHRSRRKWWNQALWSHERKTYHPPLACTPLGGCVPAFGGTSSIDFTRPAVACARWRRLFLPPPRGQHSEHLGGIPALGPPQAPAPARAQDGSSTTTGSA